MKTSNDNASTTTTPVMDGVITALAAVYAGTVRWTVEGWAAHLRPAKHPLHAINSLVKHEGEFGTALWPAAFIVTVARCVDGGMGSEEAAAEIHARRAAKAAKAA